MLRNTASYSGGGVISFGLELDGDWNLGTGTDDNTPDDYVDGSTGTAYTIDSGSGNSIWYSTAVAENEL